MISEGAWVLLKAIPYGHGKRVAELTPEERDLLKELRRQGLVIEPPRTGLVKRSYAGALAVGSIRPPRAA